MSGSWVLIVLIVVSSLPIIAVFIWFRAAKYRLPLIQFSFALLAGAAAFFPALVMQSVLSVTSVTHGRMALFYEYFVRVAFTEELSRLILLFIFFWINSRINPDESLSKPLTFNMVKKGTAVGLIAGLGFSILESARYAASDMALSIVLLRFFTAALHGACGSRIGAAVALFPKNPAQALLRIVTAVTIHGIYNFMVTIPGIPSIAAILIAVSALFTVITPLKGGWSRASSEPKNTAIDKTAEN